MIKLKKDKKNDLNIVLKPGPAPRVDPGLESGRVEEKIGKVMTRRVDPVDSEKPSQKLGCNLLTFVFLTKTTSF